MSNTDSKSIGPYDHSFAPLPTHGRISPFAEMKHRSRRSDIWFFSSPKNKAVITLQGQLAFFQAVLSEGDLEVRGYDVDPDTIASVASDGTTVAPAMVIYGVDGGYEWRDFTNKYTDILPAKYAKTCAVAQSRGIEYKVIKGRDFLERRIEYDNWLMLCAAINRAKRIEHVALQTDIFDRCRVVRSMSFGTILKTTSADPALILASVARGLQLGILEANLKFELFGLNSELRHTRS